MRHPLSGHDVGLPSSIDNKDRSSSQDKEKVHSSDAKDLENSDSSKHNDIGKPEETKSVIFPRQPATGGKHDNTVPLRWSITTSQTCSH
jgi:hypothetical protein